MSLLKRRNYATATHVSLSRPDQRIRALVGVLVIIFLVIGIRFFVLQVLSHEFYSTLASSQHGVLRELYPERGTIYLSDPKSETGLFPAAVNREFTTVWASPRDVADAPLAARELAIALAVDEGILYSRLNRPDDPYEVLKRKVDDETVSAVDALSLEGVHYSKETFRYYPESFGLSQVTGFVGEDESGKPIGRYGLEGYWNDHLSGTAGFLSGERDSFGRLIGSIGRSIQPAKDGADLVLTIDRTIQYVACERLKAAVQLRGAKGGSVVVMNPETGAVLAMCNDPSFDANEYSKIEDVSDFNNPAAFVSYEPGSVFKPLVMAAAIDAGKVSPTSTFNDDGDVAIGNFTIRNSTLKAYGFSTMTEVLQESMNTGMVHVAKQLGPDAFRDYVQAFGFGKETGIDLSYESAGDVSSLDKRGEIWSATASFGQGIMVTPLQLATAYSAMANGGKLMRPYVVSEVRRGELVARTEPKVVSQVISQRASMLIGGMMVQVVEKGHGKAAGVPGYWVAGKTGTAQIAGPGGYLKNEHIGSFAGYAPVDNPKFVIVVKIDRPSNVEWAEQSAAPLFGEIAEFLLKYMEIPPEREE